MKKIVMPNKLRTILLKSKLIDKIEGRLGDLIFKYKVGNNKFVYLKYGEGISADSLEEEKKRLLWLQDKDIKVPHVIYYYKREKNAFLLIENLRGQPAHKVKSFDKNQVIKIAAEALYKFHHIDIKNAKKFDDVLEKTLKEINNFLSWKMLDIEKFKKNNNGRTPKEILSYLYSYKNMFAKDTFIHGDFCLPNLIINKNSYGFIDLGKSGIGDKYIDFSSMEVSIKRNFGEEWIEPFYFYYDKNLKINKEKIKYFQLIDQFYYHLKIKKIV